MNTFDEFSVQYDIQTDSHLTLSRFCTELKHELKCEVLAYTLDSIEDAFQCALSYEIFLHTYSNKRSAFKATNYSK